MFYGLNEKFLTVKNKSFKYVFMNKKKEISLIIGCIFIDLNYLTNLLKRLDQNINFITEIKYQLEDITNKENNNE